MLEKEREKARANVPIIPIAETIENLLKVFLSFTADKFIKAK